MPKTMKQDFAELQALEDAISTQIPDSGDPRYVELVTAKALLSIASSLTILNMHGIETSSKD